MKKLPKALYISHGGGPLPLLHDPAHTEMVACLQSIAAAFPRPDAVVVVSAHWEERIPSITSGPNPALIYDYYGFPTESYSIQYPANGHPDLAALLHHKLTNARIESRLDHGRGFDHGLFVPLKIMYPDADIPCVQLSLVRTLDPAQHIAIGQALGDLSGQGVLVIGSGFSFHNLKAFFNPETEESRQLNHAFEAWLLDACTNSAYREDDRETLLVQWATAPGARFAHPREEHLLPLHVCYGVAQGPSCQSFELTIMGRKSSMYLW